VVQGQQLIPNCETFEVLDAEVSQSKYSQHQKTILTNSCNGVQNVAIEHKLLLATAM
jgi:hypothetical protein